jgi:gentisate 1,2-dioxygenase
MVYRRSPILCWWLVLAVFCQYPIREGRGRMARIYVRAVESEHYSPREIRQQRLASPRVITLGQERSEGGEKGIWYLAPADEPFRTQTLQSHLAAITPQGAEGGHGHQNEAFFHILEGAGYDIHDGQRYEWQAGDCVAVHADSVHEHFSTTPRATALVIKAKATWMFLGLFQQGRVPTLADRPGLGPRQDWSCLWTPGAAERPKVLRSGDTPWRLTPDGRIRELAGPNVALRINSLTAYMQEVAPGGRSARHWHMADELVYVKSGRGHDLHWEVEADIADRYYARIAEQPTRWDWQATNLVYIPPNTVHQHFNDDPSETALLLCAHNRLYSYLGYANAHSFEQALEYVEATEGEAVSAIGGGPSITAEK